MAVFNEILVGRFNRYLQKLTSIKGPAPTPALGTEISGQLDLNSVKTEDRYLLSIDSFWLTNSTGPTAAATSSCRLRNPQTSNVIAVIEFIGFWESVQDIAQPGIEITFARNILGDLATSGIATPLDSRTARVGSVCVNSVQAGALPLANVLLTVPEVTANSFFGLTLYEAMEIPLLPGSAVQVTTTAVNTHLEVTMKWRERFLEDSERS